jgi:hypothetical protein
LRFLRRLDIRFERWPHTRQSEGTETFQDDLTQLLARRGQSCPSRLRRAQTEQRKPKINPKYDEEHKPGIFWSYYQDPGQVDRKPATLDRFLAACLDSTIYGSRFNPVRIRFAKVNSMLWSKFDTLWINFEIAFVLFATT